MQIKATLGLSKLLPRYYAVVLAVLTFFSAFVVFHTGKTYLISAKEDLSFLIARNISHEINDQYPGITRSLVEMSVLDKRRLDSIAQEHLSRFDLKGIDILDLNNRIVYSTDTSLVGMLNQDLTQFKARSGVPQSTVAVDNRHSSSEQTGRKLPYFKSFIPWRVYNDHPTGKNKLVGAFQIFQDGAELNQSILKLRNAVFGASLLFFTLVTLCFRIALARAKNIHRTLRQEMKIHAQNLEKKVIEHTEELSEEKNKLHTILNHVPSAFVLVDTDLRIQSASAALGKFAGQKLSDVKGQHCYDIICKRNPVEICPTRKAIKSNRIETCLLALKRNSEKQYLEHIAVPITNNGKTESVLEIITDITEKKKMQDSIIQAEKLSAVGQMAATIAHEIRNGLTSVKLILQHLAPSLSKDTGKSKAANVALESINDMEKVVKQLLNFARPTPTSFKTTNINKLLEYCVELCGKQIESKHLRLYEDYSSNTPCLLMDTEHMRDAVVNLILNAIQACKNEGVLRIRTKLDSLERDISEDFIERKTTISLKKKQEVVKIEISDNGSGIPEQNRSSIFEPFFTTKIDGSGLGLPVTRRTVHEHGGVLMVDSQQGEGSTFTITLPT